MTEHLKIEAHAKINTFLTVTGRRQDGYHTILSHMARISLSDTVDLARTGDAAGIALHCVGGSEDLPTGVGNLAYRAAAVFSAAVNTTEGVAITLEKHIPSGAGLGGGSADAGAVLLGLNRLFGCPLSECRLYELALSLGADVPFAIWAAGRSAATARGIGEVLTVAPPLPGHCTLLVAKPLGSVSTPAAYRRLDALGVVGNPEDEEAYTRLEQALSAGDCKAVGAASRNVFEAAVAEDCPEVTELLRYMTQGGAVFARMSGSGSAVVGWFEKEMTARACCRKLQGEKWIAFAETAKAF